MSEKVADLTKSVLSIGIAHLMLNLIGEKMLFGNRETTKKELLKGVSDLIIDSYDKEIEVLSDKNYNLMKECNEKDAKLEELEKKNSELVCQNKALSDKLKTKIGRKNGSSNRK